MNNAVTKFAQTVETSRLYDEKVRALFFLRGKRFLRHIASELNIENAKIEVKLHEKKAFSTVQLQSERINIRVHFGGDGRVVYYGRHLHNPEFPGRLNFTTVDNFVDNFGTEIASLKQVKDRIAFMVL